MSVKNAKEEYLKSPFYIETNNLLQSIQDEQGIAMQAAFILTLRPKALGKLSDVYKTSPKSKGTRNITFLAADTLQQLFNSSKYVSPHLEYEVLRTSKLEVLFKVKSKVYSYDNQEPFFADEMPT